MGADQSTLTSPSGQFGKISSREHPQIRREDRFSVPSSPHYDSNHHRASLTPSHKDPTILNTSLPNRLRGSFPTLPSSDYPERPTYQWNKTSLTGSIKSINLASSSSNTNRPPSKSMTVCLEKNHGIVVVNPGRSGSHSIRAASSFDFGSNHPSRLDFGAMELKKLRQIPMFEPLIWSADSPRSQSLQNAPGLSSRRFIPNLTKLNCSDLVAISTEYENYLQQSSSLVCRKQTDLIEMQNQTEQNVCQLANALQAREKGVVSLPRSWIMGLQSPSSSPHKSTSSASTSPDKMPVKLAGSQQIEAIVLETSQLSGLISQCFELVTKLIGELDQLNQLLPENLKLDRLDIRI